MAVHSATFSGPGGFRQQAVTALTRAGFVVSGDQHSRGLADTVTGDKDPTQAFITVQGDDIDVDAALRAVSSLNWVLRAHRDAPKVTAPLLAEAEKAHEELIRRIVREELEKSRGR